MSRLWCHRIGCFQSALWWPVLVMVPKSETDSAVGQFRTRVRIPVCDLHREQAKLDDFRPSEETWAEVERLMHEAKIGELDRARTFLDFDVVRGEAQA